jgi:hypothetical protein
MVSEEADVSSFSLGQGKTFLELLLEGQRRLFLNVAIVFCVVTSKCSTCLHMLCLVKEVEKKSKGTYEGDMRDGRLYNHSVFASVFDLIQRGQEAKNLA